MLRLKKFIWIFVIFLVMTVYLPINATAAISKVIHNDESGIPDKVLYQAILSELGKSGIEYFTEEEAADIISLTSNNYNKKEQIKSLKGLRYLKNLKNLDVAVNQLVSLSGIEESFKLESLVISHNKLTDLSGVEKLKKIVYISAWDNQLNNINAISELVKLESIELNGNRLTSLEAIKKLKGLKSIYATGNRLKRLPNLKKHTKLSDVNFKYNLLSKKQLKENLPSGFTKSNDYWFKSQVQFQKLVKTINIVKPKSFTKINKKTRKIVGIANKKATIVLRDPNGKKILTVKSDNKGNFIFKNLNLSKWVGKTLSIKSYIVDQVYDERYNLKTVKFTVRN